MRRILGFSGCLCTSVLGLLLASGCGQSEGERCQVDSDCASGLKCSEGSTGNGTCKQPSAVVSSKDAAVSLDGPLSSLPEVEPQVDAETVVDSTPASQPDAAVGRDTTALDVMSVDTGSID